MIRILLLWLGLSMCVMGAEAAPDELTTGPAATSESSESSVEGQKIPRPRYKRYGRRRRLRAARRKARKERRKAPRRKGVITVDPPVRNQ
jgi:hypothetical protein